MFVQLINLYCLLFIKSQLSVSAVSCINNACCPLSVAYLLLKPCVSCLNLSTHNHPENPQACLIHAPMCIYVPLSLISPYVCQPALTQFPFPHTASKQLFTASSKTTLATPACTPQALLHDPITQPVTLHMLWLSYCCTLTFVSVSGCINLPLLVCVCLLIPSNL